MNTSRIPSLDGLRALSIVMVLFEHLRRTHGFLPRQFTRWTGPVGPLGVQVFFVISGFLITGLLLNEYRKTGAISLRMFYFRRAFRILPASFVYIAVILLAVLAGVVTLKRGDLFHLLTYTVNYQVSPAWEIGHIWSLSVEEHFYLVWPLVLCVLGIRTGFGFAAALLLIAPGCRYLIILLSGSSAPSYQTQAVADSLATGACLAGLRPWLHVQPWYRRLLQSRLAAVAPWVALAANLYPYGPVRWLVATSLINLAIAVTVDRYVTHPEFAFGRLLNCRPAAFLGVISYSLYLWQQPFLNGNHTAWITTFPQNLVLTLAAAVGSYYLVESPCLRLRKRIEDHWSARTARPEVVPAGPPGIALAE